MGSKAILMFDNVKKQEWLMYASKPEFNVMESDEYGAGEDRLRRGDRFELHMGNVLLQVGRDIFLESLETF